MSKFQKDIDMLLAVNSVDIDALEEAKATLEYMQEELLTQNQYIKETLKLINRALAKDPIPTIEKLSEHLKEKSL